MGTAHPGIIALDLAAKQFASEVDCRSAELVEDHPSGFVTSKPKLTLEKQCRNPALVGCHQVGGPEPKRQRSLSVVKDGSRSERDLVAAGGTLPAPSSHQGVAMSMGTSGTLEALRPAAGGQVTVGKPLRWRTLTGIRARSSETAGEPPAYTTGCGLAETTG